jgi:ATP-dependent Zn protease
MSNNTRRTVIALFIVIPIFVIVVGLSMNNDSATRWSLTQVAEAAQDGRIERIVVATDAEELQVTLDDGTTVLSGKDSGSTVFDQLSMLGVTNEELEAIEWKTDAIDNWSNIFTILLTLLPMIIFAVFIYAVMRTVMRRQQPPGDYSSHLEQNTGGLEQKATVNVSTNIRRIRMALLIVVLVFLLIAGLLAVLVNNEKAARWSLTQVAEAARDGRIERIVVSTNTEELQITLNDGTTVLSNKDSGGTALEQLNMLGVTPDELAAIEWEAGAIRNWSTILTALVTFVTMIVFLTFIVVLLRGATITKQPPAS